MMYPVLYKVIYWSEINRKEETAYGVVIADSYEDAMGQVESYYGDITTATLSMNEEGTVYEFNLEDKFLEEYLQNVTAN